MRTNYPYYNKQATVYYIFQIPKPRWKSLSVIGVVAHINTSTTWTATRSTSVERSLSSNVHTVRIEPSRRAASSPTFTKSTVHHCINKENILDFKYINIVLFFIYYSAKQYYHRVKQPTISKYSHLFNTICIYFSWVFLGFKLLIVYL